MTQMSRRVQGMSRFSIEGMTPANDLWITCKKGSPLNLKTAVGSQNSAQPLDAPWKCKN
jgi:hypothetical protein